MNTTAQVTRLRRPHLTLRQKFAVLLFTFTVLIPAINYWQHGGRVILLGYVPMPALFLFACIGGAVSFVLFAGPQHRWFAAIPGAIAGLGAFGVHILYTQWWEHETINSVESLIVAAVGASPGILFYWLVARIGKSKERSIVDP